MPGRRSDGLADETACGGLETQEAQECRVPVRGACDLQIPSHLPSPYHPGRRVAVRSVACCVKTQEGDGSGS